MSVLLDIAGHKFGLLTAERISRRDPRVFWLCNCDCGAKIEVQSNNLRSGNTSSCGCTRSAVSRKLWQTNRDNMKPPRPLIDILGRRFGRLIAIQLVQAATVASPRTVWKFRCDCGAIVDCESYNVRTGHTTSCGCAVPELVSQANTTHGHARVGHISSEYRSWLAMRARCSDPAHDAYKYYGGRGISVCAEWRGDFARFLADMGNKPTPKHTIDRYPNNDGNYDPGNCRWATMTEQMASRRTVERKAS